MKSPSLQSGLLIIFAVLNVIAAGFAYPWRLVSQTRWGERSLLFGGPFAFILWSCIAAFPAFFKTSIAIPTGLDGYALISALVWIWLAQVLSIYIREPDPLKWSLSWMQGFPRWLPIKNSSQLIADILPGILAIWAFRFGWNPAATALGLMSAGAIVSTLIQRAIWRSMILDGRDQQIKSASLGLEVSPEAQSFPNTQPDLRTLYGK